MPAERPIQFSREQRLEGKIARLKADIEHHKESAGCSKAGIRYQRMDDCSGGEMVLALEALKKHPGATFEQCLAELRRE